jgi:hypothetical protein
MQMGTEYPRRDQAFKEILIKGKGLEGSETEPGQAVQVGQGPDEITEVDAEVPAVEAQVDAREHNLRTAAGDDGSHLRDDLVKGAADRPSPEEGNDAVAAEMITAILDFHEGPATKVRGRQAETVPACRGPPLVTDDRPRGQFTRDQGSHGLGNLGLAAVSDEKVDGKGDEILGRRLLSPTAGDDKKAPGAAAS